MVALRTRGVTALLIKEHRVTVASELDLSADPLSVLAENVLLLHQLEHHAKLHRVLSVIKMRYSAHDALLHEFAIEQPEGVQLIGTYRSADEMLAAVARHVEGGAEGAPHTSSGDDEMHP
jgi:circadian clock protein KaiC